MLELTIKTNNPYDINNIDCRYKNFLPKLLIISETPQKIDIEIIPKL